MFQKIYGFYLLAILAIVMATSSCTYYYEENQQCTIVVPDTVSFSTDILPIFQSTCTNYACHVGYYPAGNLNLEDANAYEELSHPGSGYINLDNPKHSILYNRINQSANTMPPEGKIEQCQIDMILKWIEQGAKNN